jgi:glycosyl transferase, family 25
MKLFEYFDRTCIIHLPERVDRFRALEREFKLLGADIRGPKVQVPFAPRPDDAHGYSSKGVYGSFLSHFGILKDAVVDGLDTVWVLEDDAIFSNRMVRQQERTVDFLQRTSWDMCFFGHSLTRELAGIKPGLVHHEAPFKWAHCYAVHSRVLPRLVSYLKATISYPRGHPRGGKVYIDGAYNLFRKLNPDVVSLVANPVMSLQRGSPSGLGHTRWYDHYRITHSLAFLARVARDEIWRRTGFYYPAYVTPVRSRTGGT